MNKTHIAVSVLFFSLLVTPVRAHAEQPVMEPMMITVHEMERAAKPFSMIVTDEGELVTKPGTLFTSGQEAEGTVLPHLVSTPKLISYPRWAVRKGWAGEVVVAVEVLKNGDVGRLFVMESTGHPVLDEAATEALKSWKFEPANLKGEPILSCVQIPITFELRDK